MNKARLIEAAALGVTKELTDKGKLIEAGFAAFAHFVIPKDAPPIQLKEMQLAFMAGADHLFSSIMGILDPGEEPTNKDLERMELIHNELQAFIQDFQLRHAPTKGSA